MSEIIWGRLLAINASLGAVGGRPARKMSQVVVADRWSRDHDVSILIAIVGWVGGLGW